MNKNKLVNVILVILVGLTILLIAKETLAATDLTNTITNSSSSRNNTTGSGSTGNSSGNSSSGNSSTGNSSRNSSSGNSSSTGNNSVMRTNNTSNYNNSSLPKTGIEDTFPSVVLIVVFGISAVYAYKKIKKYRNI